MTARSIRRAQERKLRKVAEKAARLTQSQPVEDQSEARLAANQTNALLSTGPRTEEGKAISSLNAVKTGLTGRTVLLPSDDADAYRRHASAYESEYRPVGLRETELVQSLADTQWRLQRIPGLEMAIYARGRQEFADSYSEHDDLDLPTSLIDLDVHFKYEKQLRNLQLQEARLKRRYEKEMTELRQLQQERRAKEQEATGVSAETMQTNVADGFDFSEDDVALESHALFATPDGPPAQQSA